MISLPVVERFNGVVLYRGPSEINGEPIVVVAVNLRRDSKNTKTGDFIQTYILSDGPETPVQAIANGKDAAICGNCIHRRENGWGTCYVNVGQGPNQVFGAVQRGSYPKFTPDMLQEYFAGRVIRLGSYGDPAAMPVYIWKMICETVEGWTGYTHQWRTRPELKPYCMASVETVHQQNIARKMGWKTFRVRNDDEPLQPNEFVCPASHEAGKRLQCEDCLACHGGEWNGKQFTPVILVHGTQYKPVRFRVMQKVMRNKKRYRTLKPSLIGVGSKRGVGTGVISK